MTQEQKLRTAESMIRVFCEGKHHRRELCESCSGLLNYIAKHLNECHLPEENSSCFMCPDYCYCPEMRQKIKEVMRYAAPRMLLKRPILMIKHLRHLRKLNRYL